MSISRREFLQVLAAASAAGFSLSGCENGAEDAGKSGGGVKPSKAPSNPYELPPFGNVSLMHFTDSHAQLLPHYFREPNINLGVASMKGNAPHLVGKAFLEKYNMQRSSRDAYAFTYLDFEELARKYGKVGGFAHMTTLVKHLRAQRPGALLLDGGDTWQGSATALWSNGQDMIGAQLLMGVDIMTAHWDFTYGAERIKHVIENDFKGKIDFLAQNVVDNDWGERVFNPYVIKEINGVPVGIIGQAFPYTPIANPRYMVPDWSFGIREDRMQQIVDEVRAAGAHAVILHSHNGMDVDLKMASRVTGIDAILGGHTHDGVPAPVEISNAGGKTLVMNSGCNGKFLSVLDLDVRDGKVRDYRYKLLPIFADLLEADPAMSTYIDEVRAPYQKELNEELAVADDLLYRRGNFTGSFDQLICDALRESMDAEIAFSPGFRWGVSILPGQPITFDDLMTQTAITYPTVTVNRFTGTRIKEILEDVADNLFNKDPYYQQGGDMVRVGGMDYAIDPTADIGNRISEMQIKGKPIDPNKEYSVAGWASVAQPLEGIPIWDVVADYLREKKTVQVGEPNTPKIKNLGQNPGLELV
jgi:sulfur-oxidizing protein SoxB